MKRKGENTLEIKSCERLIDYLNRGLNEMEMKKFEQHIKTCDDCQKEIAEWEILTSDLPYAVLPIEPPEGMKQRVFANVFSQEEETSHKPREKTWVKPLLAAALFISLLGNVLAVIDKQNDEGQPETAVIDRLEKSVSLQASENVDSVATAIMIKKDDMMELIIHADNLTVMEGSEVYQVWLLEDGKPSRAGTFIPNETGEGGVTYSLVNDSGKKWDTIAITREPDGTSETPKGSIILSQAL